MVFDTEKKHAQIHTNLLANTSTITLSNVYECDIKPTIQLVMQIGLEVYYSFLFEVLCWTITYMCAK